MAPQDAWGAAPGTSAAPAAEAGAGGRDPAVDALIADIQRWVFRRRIRATEAFRDFDQLRSGRCTQQQFLRALNFLQPSLRAHEGEALAAHFTEAGRQVRWPQTVSYTKFCQAVDGVFGPRGLEKQPSARVPLPGTLLPCAAGFVPEPVDDPEQLRDVLRRIAVLVETRGVELHGCLSDAGRPASALGPFPRNSGKLAQHAFLQRFPFVGDIPESGMQLLLQRYRTELDFVQVQAFLKDVLAAQQDLRLGKLLQETLAHQPRPGSAVGPRLRRSSSAAVERPRPPSSSPSGLRREASEVLSERTALAPPSPSGSAAATLKVPLLPRRPLSALEARHHRRAEPPPPAKIGVVAKIGALVVERRLRLNECFQDFDRLRTGSCSASHVKSALTVLRLELTAAELASLFDLYRGEEGGFRYRDFCADVAAGEAGEAPARAAALPLRHKVALSPEELVQLEEVQTRMSWTVRMRRMEVKGVFDDFCRRCGAAAPGHVTSRQLPRILSLLGLAIGEEAVELLRKAYCDTEDGQGFNYLSLCAAIDPSLGGAAAAKQATAPPPTELKRPQTYFDGRGQVVPHRLRPCSAPSQCLRA